MVANERDQSTISELDFKPSKQFRRHSNSDDSGGLMQEVKVQREKDALKKKRRVD